MTILSLRKNEPSADGFFDMERSRDARRASVAALRAQRTTHRTGHAAHRVDEALTEATGVYALSLADARHMNAGLDMPEQPVYDWSDVAGDEDE